ncbi:helix-turn-helix domain-containing protein [Streptomyces sp. SL13]|uniref:Helix-turn-helix domain-containing protein n=1 Tax=Streptantibioticus silvisoli TaxID=2705255 RepID=A0AA90H098_9ACTN|nr:helix-turn-helix domain-containing protein [Streptantibioticus silvisoli]MDI5968633.1 helix-turn-helix domain-containing protein [Streptantibioticus silvisoli]
MTTAVPEALTVPEVMAALRISRSKVYDLFRARELPSFTIGRSRRVTAAALTAYMTKRTEEND